MQRVLLQMAPPAASGDVEVPLQIPFRDTVPFLFFILFASLEVPMILKNKVEITSRSPSWAVGMATERERERGREKWHERIDSTPKHTWYCSCVWLFFFGGGAVHEHTMGVDRTYHGTGPMKRKVCQVRVNLGWPGSFWWLYFVIWMWDNVGQYGDVEHLWLAMKQMFVACRPWS